MRSLPLPHTSFSPLTPGLSSGYSSGYYAVTPAGFLHEFKDNDDFRKDPVPEVSLYLPDCIIGALDGNRFTIKGKDTSGGKMGSHLARTSDFAFQAHTPHDAKLWHDIIASKTSGTSSSVPTSPVESRGASAEFPPAQQQGSVGGAGGLSSVEEKERAQMTGQGPPPGQINTGGVGGYGGMAGAGQQESGVVSGGPQSAGYPQSARTQGSGVGSETTPLSAGSAGTHFHGAPASNDLEERKYVQR